jgi:hypothetical protein
MRLQGFHPWQTHVSIWRVSVTGTVGGVRNATIGIVLYYTSIFRFWPMISTPTSSLSARRPPEDLAILSRSEKQLEAAFDDINDNYYAAGCPLSRLDAREWSRVIMPHIRQLLKKYEHAIQDTMSYRRGIAENARASTLRRQRRDFVQSVVDFDEKLQNLAESLNVDGM